MTTDIAAPCTDTEHVLLLDEFGHCRWASASLAGILGFDPARAGRLRLADDLAGLAGLTTALAGDAGVLLRVRTIAGGHAWFTARGVAIAGSPGAAAMLLVRMRPAPVEDEARAALRASSHLDHPSGLLTRGSLVDRLAHPACDGDRALVVLQAETLADTPWGTSQRRLGRAMRIVADSARACGQDLGHGLPVIGRIGPDRVAFTVCGPQVPGDVGGLARRLASAAQQALRTDLDTPTAQVTARWHVRQPGQSWIGLLPCLLGALDAPACE